MIQHGTKHTLHAQLGHILCLPISSTIFPGWTLPLVLSTSPSPFLFIFFTFFSAYSTSRWLCCKDELRGGRMPGLCYIYVVCVVCFLIVLFSFPFHSASWHRTTKTAHCRGGLYDTTARGMHGMVFVFVHGAAAANTKINDKMGWESGICRGRTVCSSLVHFGSGFFIFGGVGSEAWSPFILSCILSITASLVYILTLFHLY